MERFKALVCIVGLSVTATACQKQATELSSVTEGANQTLACKTQKAPVNANSLEIEGSTTAKKGEPVFLNLNQDLNCSNSQKVSWTIPAGAKLQSLGSSAKIIFPSAGEYAVTATVAGPDSTTSTEMVHKAVVLSSTSTVISGPQVGGTRTLLSFELTLPAGTSLSSASWNFGDNSAPVSSLGKVEHFWLSPGKYTVTVTVRDSSQKESTIAREIVIVESADNLECVSDTVLSSPSEGVAGTPVGMSIYLSACMIPYVTNVSWDFGDGSPRANGTQVQHTYLSAGTFVTTVRVTTSYSDSEPWFTLTRVIQVSPAVVVPTPTPTDVPEVPDPTPTPTVSPTPVPTPKPTPSPSPTPAPTPMPTPVSCRLPDGSTLPHGSIRTGVVIGETQSPRVCGFGEQGIVDVFHLITDQICTNGKVQNINTRQGVLKAPGQCPTYSWSPTDRWTGCTDNCGGSQSRIFECHNDKNEAVASERCSATQPVQERLCDANPEAVRRTEVDVVQEDGGTTTMCPRNQIGVTISRRDVKTIRAFACIEHKVQLENEKKEYGNWVTESYCRDYVTKRCSHDSLDNNQAHARYQWMLKCQDQVPVIKEFLTQFDDVQARSGKSKFSIDAGSRILYPTFMNRATNPEKAWIAPKHSNAGCSVPPKAYIAAVCVSSCATPEQEILAQAQEKMRLRYVPFVEALTKSYTAVATLRSSSTLKSKSIQMTPVDQWVTELVDSEHAILEFTMRSGRSLRLTPNHPVLTEHGSMKHADEFQVGERLVELGGALDPIVSIREEKYYGKVYNLFVKSNEPHKNVVVTNGYLNGTAYFQNEGAKDLNRGLFRNKLLEGAFRK